MLLVHVAGTADLGIPLAIDGRSRPRQETAELTESRLGELDACRTGEEAADLLLDLRFRSADRRADGAEPGTSPGSALRKELRAVARLAGERGASPASGGPLESFGLSGSSEPAEPSGSSEPSESSESIEVLVVGVEGGSTPTDSIARALVRALGRASAEASRLLDGREFGVLDACILPGLAVGRDSIETLESAIGGHDGHVVLALAGGANAVLAEAAGVAAATHGDEWSLLLIDRAGRALPDAEAPVVDMSVGEDPLRGWLMGLGLPTVLAEERERDGSEVPEEVRLAAAAIRRAMGETSPEAGGGAPAGSQDEDEGGGGAPAGPRTEGGASADTRAAAARVKDLALLLHSDAARGDLAAGMALRAWITAEYRRRRLEYLDETGLPAQDYRDATRRSSVLGTVIEKLKERAQTEPLAAPDAWLAAQRDLVDLGIEATHRLAAPGEDLHEQVNAALGAPPAWLSWPSGCVCLLTAQGVSYRAAQRDPIAVTLLSAEPGEALRRACSVPGPLTLETLIACSEASVGEGRAVVEALRDDRFERNSGWNPVGDDGAVVYSYESSTTQGGALSDQVAGTMRETGRCADEWLEGRPTRPRAIIVTVVGEKPIVIALLHAAQVFGARHGIPVFLMSSVAQGAGERLQLHQFGLDRDVRLALLRATRYCLDRLDLLTAARLLTLGDPAMEELADGAQRLADELAHAARTEDLDGCAGTVLAVMASVAERIDGLPPDARVRLATIIGELINPTPKKQRSEAFRDPVVLALMCWKFDQGYEAGSVDLDGEPAPVLLRLLVRVRNKVPINHGSKGLREAVRDVLKNYRQASRCTYPQLLGRAVAAVVENHPGAGPGDWGSRLGELRRRVGALETGSYEEEK